MNFLFLKIIQHPAKQIIKLWLLFVSIVFLEKILKVEVLDANFVVVVACSGFLMWTFLINLQGVPALLRRYSRSVNHFWFMLIGLQITNLLFNSACFIVFILIANIKLNFDILNYLSPIDYFWIFLIGFNLGINMLNDTRVTATNLIHRKLGIIALMQFLGACIFIIIAFLLLIYSRVLGYAIIEAALISYFFLTNNLVSNSLPRAVLKKSFYFGLVQVVLLFLASQLIGVKQSQLSMSLHSALKKEMQSFFSAEKKWSFSELENIQTVSQWVAWKSSATALKPEQLLKALDKLEVLCPAIPTDFPGLITCFEKNPTEQNAEIIIIAGSNEADILNQLKSPNMYTRLVGLLAARNLEKFSSELTAKLQEIYHTPGRLSAVAEKTLNNVKNEKVSVVKIRILAEPVKPSKN